MHTLRRLPIPLPRSDNHVSNHNSARSGIVTSNSLTWKYGISPLENSTGSDTALTYGYLLYQPACNNLFSPDCPHVAPPILRRLELLERRQNFLQRFPLPNRPL